MTLTAHAACGRHSRLGGSRDIERWIQQAATGLQSTYRENVLKPLQALQAELFKTFRSALPSACVLPHPSTCIQPSTMAVTPVTLTHTYSSTVRQRAGSAH